MSVNILTLPDPNSDIYFDDLVAILDAASGLSPIWASQWRALAQGAATLRATITSDLNALRAQIATIQNEITRLQTGAARWAYGTGTIAAGALTVSVLHGLAGTPSAVLVTPTRALAGADLWHETPDATQFTVATSAAPAAPVTFNWLAALTA